MDRLYKDILHDPVNLDDRIFENVKLSEQVVNFTMRPLENWRVELATEEENQEQVDILRSIFYADSLSPLLFLN